MPAVGVLLYLTDPQSSPEIAGPALTGFDFLQENNRDRKRKGRI